MTLALLYSFVGSFSTSTSSAGRPKLHSQMEGQDLSLKLGIWLAGDDQDFEHASRTS
jgi:hypothetical protein